MKRSVLPILLLVVTSLYIKTAHSQVGIGTSSPNAKAVLELKSPGNNQGFLVPRLTTIQRTGMTGLTATEKGLLVFDTDTNEFYYWNGSTWIAIVDSTGTDSQTLTYNPATGQLTISGGNNISLTGTIPGGTAGGDLTGNYPNPTVANNAVTSAKLQSDVAVDANRAVTTNHIRDNAVVSGKILDGTIATADIANTAITDAKIASGITVSKLTASATNSQVLTTVAGVTTWANLPASGTGSVTNVATGTGLTGGPITTTGTISIAANGVTATELRSDAAVDANRSVTTIHIRDNAIVSGKISDGTITNVDINTSAAIDVTKVAAGTNGQVLLTSGTTPTWSAMPPPSGAAGGDLTGTYPNPTINLGAVITNRIADLAVNTLKLADNAVSSIKILDGTVATADILDGTIATVDILDGAISTLKIADNNVTTAKILDGTLATADLANGSVTSAKVLDGDLATADLADGAITSLKILDGTLATADLANGSVTSAKVLDGDLATADLADGAITSLKILDGTLATADLANGSVTSAKVLDGDLATADLADASITSLKIVDGAITNADINAAAGIAISKVAAGTAGQLLLTIGTTPTWSGIGGDLAGTFPNPTVATTAGNNLLASINNAATTGTINTSKLNTSVVLDTESPSAGDVSGSFTGGIQINADAVTSSEILDGTIATGDIANAAITNAKVASGIDVAKLTASPIAGQVLTTVLGNVAWATLPGLGGGTVTSVDTGTGLTGGPITSAGTISIAANGVTATELRSDPTTDALRAVTTDHIRDGAVNSAKILNGSLLNADVSASAGIVVSKLAAGSVGDVLTTIAAGPTWQAPADNSATNELQTLGGVLTQGTDAGNLKAVNFSNVSIGRSDSPGALNVNGAQYVSFTALAAAITNYSIVANDYIIIGTSSPNIITNVTIPDAGTNIGRILVLKGRSVGSVAAAGVQPVLTGTDTLDGSTNPPILTPVGANFTTLTIIAISANEWITINRTHN